MSQLDTSLYITLATELRETLGPHASLISPNPVKQMVYSIPASGIFDEFVNIFNYKLLTNISEGPRCLLNEMRSIEETLLKYNIFCDNSFQKSREISDLMDTLLETKIKNAQLNPK